MLEKALHGSRRYWTLIGILSALALVGVIAYLKQLSAGLVITGLSRDVPWGLTRVVRTGRGPCQLKLREPYGHPTMQ